MFKRLFFLSGIIAFLLTGLTMWFWYLPNMESEVPQTEAELNQMPTDSVAVVDTIR